MLTINDIQLPEFRQLLASIGIEVCLSAAQQPIPASYWGAPEAGLRGPKLYVRSDTPVHSALHETAHFICMTPARRAGLDTDAGGTDTEESAVCFLQVCLADLIPGFGQHALMQDMDAWGYSFRLGSTRQWFEYDSDDARQALRDWGLIDEANRYRFTLRGEPAADRGG